MFRSAWPDGRRVAHLYRGVFLVEDIATRKIFDEWTTNVSQDGAARARSCLSMHARLSRRVASAPAPRPDALRRYRPAVEQATHGQFAKAPQRTMCAAAQ